MSALCHPAVGQVDMAELLQTQEDIFRGINTKSEKLELIAEVHKGAPQNEKMPPYKTSTQCFFLYFNTLEFLSVLN